MSELSKVRHPPARLSWPSGLGKKKSSTSTKAAADTKANSRKRPRFSSTFTSTADSTAMWVDRFTPSSSTELCVASKRVKEIKAWIEEALSENTKKLLVLVGNPGVGKSTCIHVLAKELSIDVLSWNESYVPRNEDSFRNPGLLSVEQSSPIDSFSEFLQQSGTGFSSLQLSSSDLNSVNQKSIILLEDLPNIHGFDAAQRFRKIMSQHLQRSLVPTVLIFSDVTEGKHKPVDLERLVNQTDLYSPITCCIRQVHPVTKQKMKKSLEKIAKQLKFKTSPNLLEELNLQSGGDLRHAIMNLQLHATGINSSESRDCKNFQSNNRDVKLSNFHALGKLLYAKRTTKEGRSMLAFDPEEILERSDLGMGGSLRFLEYHSADFFTDITELSDCYELYSDASTLLDHPDVSLFEFSDVSESMTSVQK
jgi:cell cycle checkpoint protein